MKRIGKTSNIMEEICEYGNIYNSLHVVMRGTKRKKSRVGRWIMTHEDEVIAMLQERIRDGTFSLSGYREMTVTDGPKVRTVQSVPLVERIGVNAIMAVVERRVFGRYIRTTSASIKNRGMHDLLNYIRRDLEEYPEDMVYAYKFDIRKFYESISQDIMMYTLRRMFKDRVLLTMLERFVRMMPKGLSIGLRSSQGYGNMLLSMFLDHYLKDRYGVRHFYRYCDDGLVLSGSKHTLWCIRDMVHECVSGMELEVKPDERVFPTSEGIDFLGYKIFGHGAGGDGRHHVLLRKRNKKNAARRLHKIKSRRRRQEIVASLYGQCKHADCHNLFLQLTGKKMTEFKRLSETGIRAKYKDGKKRFDGGEVNLADLVGEEFVIVDFETDIVTRPQKREYDEKVAAQRRELENYTTHGITPPEGFVYPDSVPKPVGKYVMSIRRNAGRENEVVAKVFTGDSENKSILEQMRTQGLLKNTLCGVKTVRCKGFNRYVLC